MEKRQRSYRRNADGAIGVTMTAPGEGHKWRPKSTITALEGGTLIREQTAHKNCNNCTGGRVLTKDK